MARMMRDNGAVPVSYFSPAAPYTVPAHQGPYYVIPQSAHSIPQYSGAPQYVYNPSSAPGYGQSNGAPVFKVVPSQSHQHQYPIQNVVPVDGAKREVTLEEALENALRQQKQPKAQMVQQIPQSLAAPNAHHPVYVIPEGTMLGQPVHYNGYPVYRAEDMGDANRSHLPFRALGNHQQPSGVHYVDSHGFPITAPDGESQPYGLPAAQPGMRWKLVPIADSDREEARGAAPIVSPRAPSAPMMLLKSPDDDRASNVSHAPDSVLAGDNVVSAECDDPYKQLLSLFVPKLKDRVQAKDGKDSEGESKVAPSISTANSTGPEVEVKAAAPKSVRIIPVTDAPRDEKRVAAVTDAPREEKRVVVEGQGSLKEKGCSGTDAQAKPLSVKKQPNKPSTPTLKPIRLVPSLEFVKKKESKPVAGSKQEKQDNPGQKSQSKVDSHQASAENSGREKEVGAEMNGKEVLAATTHDEAGPKTEVAAKRAREKSVEGLSHVESHTVQVEKGDEPSAKKKRLITDSETAARLIQSVYRGYVVRRCQPLKHLHDIARVKSMLKEYQVLAADKSSLLEKCKDPVEWTKLSEGIMSLLLQLDVIQGVDPVVREIRKYTSKEVLKLQSEVDAAKSLVSVSPQVVSQEIDVAVPQGTLDNETESVEEKLATSEEPNSAETVESVERLYNVADNGAKTLVSNSKDIATGKEPTDAKPVEQPAEQVEDLLLKLLNKLPNSGGCEGSETVHTGEFTDLDHSALISEVVKRLSLLKEQQKDKETDTRRLDNHEFSADSAHGHVEKQGESTASDMRASENSSDEDLPLISTAHEGPRHSGMADEAASDSIFEPITSSVAGGEDYHTAQDDGREGGENDLLVSEPESSPTELELQNLAETVAADFVDVVLAHSEDTVGSVQSMADNKENILQGKDLLLDSHDTILHEVSDTENGLPSQSASVDVTSGMTEAPNLVNVELELERTSHLTPTENAGGEIQTQISVTNSSVVDGEDTDGMLKASDVDNSVEEPQTLCASECATENQSNVLRDGPTMGSGEILHQNVTEDEKERTSELGSLEWRSDCKESVVERIEPANEVATNSDLANSFADDEEVHNTDLKVSLNDDPALQQIAPLEATCDSRTEATPFTHDENAVNGDAGEATVESDNALEEASPLRSADGTQAESSMGLWNGLESTWHNSLDEPSSPQRLAEGSEEVSTEDSAYPGVGEPCNIEQQSRSADAPDGFVIPENNDVAEGWKVQIPNKSFSSQEETIKADSPTSVLDAVISMAPAEDVLSEDIAEVSLDDTTSERLSIQVVNIDDSEGMRVQESILDSSLIEEVEALQLQSAISDLESLNSKGEVFLNDESLQLESAISDLHSLNDSGQGFLDDLSPLGDRGAAADSMVRFPSLERIAADVYLPKPPSLSPEARHVLEGGVSPSDVCERLCPSSVSSPSSETETNLTQHLIEENTVLKELVKDVLKWSQWQSSATLTLHKMMEKLALEVLETKTTAKKAGKCKHAKSKRAAKKKNQKL
ncbi:hypothetical protein KC19_8G182000 [Ceratodon purpureus]|uniref:BAG domain-containing protein n=1 Tax=Ceratodon purpureus TaxID=3225 RepID=A0A8T0H3J2_CERPU|nr:hypothetical protein KC19_8G182000 [Ceratodon purpureus]